MRRLPIFKKSVAADRYLFYPAGAVISDRRANRTAAVWACEVRIFDTHLSIDCAGYGIPPDNY